MFSKLLSPSEINIKGYQIIPIINPIITQFLLRFSGLVLKVLGNKLKEFNCQFTTPVVMVVMVVMASVTLTHILFWLLGSNNWNI